MSDASTHSLVQRMLRRPLDPVQWHALSAAEQARLRFSLMRSLSWYDWDVRPSWWWSVDHRTVLELKMAAALA
jgi:hypothetical protein